MFEDVSRRTFLKGTAATAALAAAGLALARRLARRGAGRRDRRRDSRRDKAGAVALQRLPPASAASWPPRWAAGCTRSRAARCTPTRRAASAPRPRAGPAGVLRRARHATAASQGQRRVRAYRLGYGLQGDRREGAGHHREGRPRVARHHPGPAPVGQVLLPSASRMRWDRRTCTRTPRRATCRRRAPTCRPWARRTTPPTSATRRWSCSSAAATATASAPRPCRASRPPGRPERAS